MLVHNSTVELIDVMGTDLDVVQSARVSFDKQSSLEQAIHYSYNPDLNNGMGGHDEVVVEQLSMRDCNLIKYLATHNHWAPFAHCYIKFRIKAPVFVARQLHKHQAGLVVSEVSRRYVSYTPEVYQPKEWRGKATNKKQGSSDQSVALNKTHYLGDIDKDCDPYEGSCRIALEAYQELLDKGVCEEQARLVLPQGAMTEWIWSGSLAAFLRVVQLRTSSDAQKETADVANQIARHIRGLFPVSYSAYFDGE